jgi:hypothetical protein
MESFLPWMQYFYLKNPYITLRGKFFKHYVVLRFILYGNCQEAPTGKEGEGTCRGWRRVVTKWLTVYPGCLGIFIVTIVILLIKVSTLTAHCTDD